MPRILVTADLHFNHARSRELTIEVIDRINRAGFDILLLAGDTATPDGDHLEQCLSRFTHAGPCLFIPGNHELWMQDGDSYKLYTQRLPRRVEACGFHYLDQQPWLTDNLAIVGTIGWYDYSFAQSSLEIPRRFYEHKISPGAAERLAEFSHLFGDRSDLSTKALDVVARWNDGRYVHLNRSDDRFLDELLGRLREHLQLAASRPRPIIVATHHLPFTELLPPPHSAQWDFAKAYLGSDRLGQVLLEFSPITHAFSGHSHFHAAARIAHIRAINLGAGYRAKRFEILDLPD